MRKISQMQIPGLPYDNREGVDDAGINAATRFFGGEDLDDHNPNSQPVISKRHQRVDDPAYEKDDVAEEYFALLQWTVNKKHRKQKI